MLIGGMQGAAQRPAQSTAIEASEATHSPLRRKTIGSRASRGERPSDPCFFFGTVVGDQAAIRFAERAPEGSGVEIFAIGGRSRPLPPGVVEITRINRVEAQVVHETKH